MGSTITCYFLAPHDWSEISLRRYRSGVECSGSYHNASVVIGREHYVHEEGLDGWPGDAPAHENERWPTRCSACGYTFQEEDHWQCNVRRLYKRSDTGELVTIGNAPVGAMWFADWYPYDKGPDGHVLCVRTPAGDWIVDGPANNSGKAWTRTGTVPKVTAHPSIGMGDKDGNWTYHGWLRDGVLVEC